VLFEFPKVLSSLGQATEFWSAIIGAVVGGFIALLIQIVALRSSKKYRDQDRLDVKRGLANSLLLKLVRVHSNFYGIHHHIESCYQAGKERGDEKNPWRFFMPLANLPETVVFSPDEMGLLFSQRDDDVFNSVLDMDVAHNSLIEVMKIIAVTRKELTKQLKVSAVEGNRLSGDLNEQEYLSIQPQVIETDGLIEQARIQAADDYKRSLIAMEKLCDLFNAKLGLARKFELIKKMEA
jgi:hypothetical protein